MQLNSSLPTLLSEFKARYPMGSLVAELLTIHQDSYVVRALVQVGSGWVASGMATHPDIEQAEDQAKIRALQAFGISSASPMAEPTALPYLPAGSANYGQLPEPLPLPEFQVIEPLPQPEAEAAASFSEPTSAVAPDFGLSSPPSADAPIPIEASLPQFDEPAPLPPLEPLSLPLSEAPDDPVLTPTPPKPEKAAKKKAEPAVPAEGDRSNEIARIGVEMKRLGWTTEQGRNYLRRTYGKRSRQELDDIELLDFLRYLETQPSPTESLF